MPRARNGSKVLIRPTEELKSEDIIQNFKFIVDLGVCIKESPVENQQVFVQLVNIYKQKVGTDKWNKFINDPFFLPGAVNKINALLSQ